MQESYLLRIGRHVQAKRIERGLTEKQLASGICSVAMLRDIEAGQTFATLNLLQNLAERLDITLQDPLSSASQAQSQSPLPTAPDEDRTSATYRQILTMIERIESVDDLPSQQWYSFMLNKADALIHTGQIEQAIDLLVVVQERADLDAEIEQSLLAVIAQKLGLAYYHAPNMLESYTHYMRAYLISAHFNEYSPLTTRITRDLARVGEALGGTKQLADQLFQLGVEAQEANQLNRACTYLEQANALYKAHNMVTMGQEMKLAYESLVRIQRHPEHAIQELIFTAKRLEKAGDTHQLANTYAQKADLHLNLGQTEAAMQDLLLAHALFQEEWAMKDPRLTLVYHVHARYCLLTGDYPQAVLYGEKSARCYEEMKFHPQAADSLQFAVEAYRRQGLEEQAKAAEEQMDRLKKTKLSPL